MKNIYFLLHFFTGHPVKYCEKIRDGDGKLSHIYCHRCEISFGHSDFYP